MLKQAGVGGVFGLIMTARIIVIAALAAYGRSIRGKPLDS